LSRLEEEVRRVRYATPWGHRGKRKEVDMGSDNLIDTTKEYLSDTRYTIKLDDLVIQQIREILPRTSEDNFAVGTAWSIEEFTRRLKEYERIGDDLLRVSSLVAFWGTRTHLPVLRHALARLTDRLDSKPGLAVWNELRWYPVLLLLYSTGISALAAERYDNLASILLTRIGTSRFDDALSELVLAIGKTILELNRIEAFKQLPGQERQYVPRSEYLFKLLQPMLDDLLFLGRDYENYFDRFEVLLALVYADLEKQYGKLHFWCPVGRFAWKFRDTRTNNPLKEIIEEADREKDSWGPIKAGLFSEDYSRFKDVASNIIKFLPKEG